MRARYENDPIRGPGYGLLYVEDVDTANTDVRFAFIRSSDHKTLHPENWEDTECRLVPDGVTVRGNGLCLAIGPGIVRQLDELNTYRFVLFPPAGGPLKAPLELSGVIYPLEDGSGRVSASEEAKPAPAPPPPPPAPEPEPERELTPEPPPVSGKKSLVVWLMLIALLALLAGAGVWFMVRDKPAEVPAAETVAEPAPESSQAAEQKEPEPAASVSSQPEPPAVPAFVPPPVPPLEQARQFLRGDHAAAAGLALSRTLPQTPEGRDAAYLLLESAAEQGDPEAMLELAAFYDPLDATAKGSILPDAEQAWEWYGKAEKAGQAAATGRKGALRAWLEGEAGKGSTAARGILSRIK